VRRDDEAGRLPSARDDQNVEYKCNKCLLFWFYVGTTTKHDSGSPVICRRKRHHDCPSTSWVRSYCIRDIVKRCFLGRVII